MTDNDFDADLAELSSAEDFLHYFEIDHDPAVVLVCRLHILKRWHDYLAQVEEMPDSTRARWILHADLLRQAYQDFVASNALTEQVFRVHRRARRQAPQVPLNDLLEGLPHAREL